MEPSGGARIELLADHPMVQGIRVGDLVTQIELATSRAVRLAQEGQGCGRNESISTASTRSQPTARSQLRAPGYPAAPTGLDVTIRGNNVSVTLTGAKDTATVEVNLDNRERLLTLRDRILDALTFSAAAFGDAC